MNAPQCDLAPLPRPGDVYGHVAVDWQWRVTCVKQSTVECDVTGIGIISGWCEFSIVTLGGPGFRLLERDGALVPRPGAPCARCGEPVGEYGGHEIARNGDGTLSLWCNTITPIGRVSVCTTCLHAIRAADDARQAELDARQTALPVDPEDNP